MEQVVESAVSVQGLSAAYGGRKALVNVNVEIPARGITAIIGPSGCGKSTFLSCLNRTIDLVEGASATGTILLEGQDISRMSADDVRMRVGMVMQKPSPFPFSVERNVSYALRYRGVPRAQIPQIVTEQLKMVGLYDELEGDVRRSALALSGGQQQRLCIARALACSPDVLLLDEPCSALDVASGKVIEAVLARVAEERAVVVVTHNLAQARRLAQKVVCLAAGSVMWQGTADDLFENHQDDVLAPLYGGDLL